jgi:hypothetical protein
VFDGTPDQLSTGVAREIYGADESFNEAATSTSIPTDTSPPTAPTRTSCCRDPLPPPPTFGETMQKLLTATALVALMATSAFAQEITEFNIGILGGENAQDRMTNLECFRAKVEAELGVPTKLFTPADYDGVIQGLLGGSLDFAWLGASAYAKTYLTNPDAVDVMLTKQNLDGTTGYYAIGFAKADSGITSMDDAKGKIFAFADPNSTSGYLVPGAELTETYGNLEDYFRRSEDVRRARTVHRRRRQRRLRRRRGLGRRPWQLGRRLQLGRVPQGRRLGPGRHDHDPGNLALEADPRRPDGRQPHLAAGRQGQDAGDARTRCGKPIRNAPMPSPPARRRTSSRQP